MDKVINDGVFSKIIGTRTTKSTYDLFIEQQKLYSPTDDQLTEFTGKYTKLINVNKELFQLLSSIEELVMQLRSLDKLEDNVKYSIGGRNNEYIYARASFYRHDHDKKTITDIIGKTEVYGSALSNFSGNEDLRTRAVTYLAIKMNDVIQTNTEYVDNLYTEMFGELK